MNIKQNNNYQIKIKRLKAYTIEQIVTKNDFKSFKNILSKITFRKFQKQLHYINRKIKINKGGSFFRILY